MTNNDFPLILSIDHEKHHPKTCYSEGEIVAYDEVPERAEVIRAHLGACGLGREVLPPEMPWELFLNTHTRDYLEALSSLSRQIDDPAEYKLPYVFAVRPEVARLKENPMEKIGAYSFDLGSPVGKGTWEAAVSSAAAAYHGAELLLEGDKLAYALCRPPGHHAGADTMGGFCYLNNAAIAVNVLKEAGKVALLDIDYHHGNGSQAIFWDDPQVMFVSIHADPRFDYPGFSGFADETGGPEAEDLTVNYPLPLGTTGDAYLDTLEQALERIAAFAPRYVVVSLGFDTLKDDPVGSLGLAVEDYLPIGEKLATLSQPVLLVQEGGYAVEDLPLQAEGFVRGLV